MRSYELTLVLVPEFKADKKSIEEVIKLHCGNDVNVVSLDIWGKKRLAYPIKKYNDGVYVIAQIESKGIAVDSIEKQMKLGSQIIRYLLTVKE